MDEPRVIATGNTLNLLTNEYLVFFPDGTRQTMYAVAPRTARDEMAAAQKHARKLWRRRKRQKQYEAEVSARVARYVGEAERCGG
jgi:hypothetical protein